MIIDEQSFLKDVATHQLHIILDDGVYRHIRFKRPESGCMHFDLVTWPGYLAYSGDMGCYVFSRLNDMFEFFRTDREYSQRDGRQLRINLGYWAEKLQAVDGSRHQASATEFSFEKFSRVICDIRMDWMRNGGLSKDDRRDLWEAVREQVLDKAEDGDEHVAYNAANEFWEKYHGRTFQFQDLWDYNFTEYTYRFVWCCYALAWGIKFYDEAKALTAGHESLVR